MGINIDTINSRTRMLFEQLANGEITLSMERPEEGFITHSKYWWCPDDPCESGGQGETTYDSRNEQLVIASPWPGRLQYDHAEGKFIRPGQLISRDYDPQQCKMVSKYTEEVHFDKIPVRHAADGSIEWIDNNFPNEDGWKQDDQQYQGEEVKAYIVWPTAKAYAAFCQDEYENDDGGHTCFTEEEWEAYQKAEEEKAARELFKKMNRWTSDFCKKHEVDVCSLEFLDKLQEHFEAESAEWEFRMEGAREDGLCLGMGCTAEQWYDHMDGLREGLGRVDDLAGEVWEWCEKEFPLLVAQWRARKETVST